MNLTRPHGRHIYQLLVGLSVLAIKDKGLFPVLGVLVIYFAGFCVAGYRIRSADYTDFADKKDKA